IRDCATRNKDNLDEGERQCLFNLVAERCINKPLGDADKAIVVDCYRSENAVWDGLLNENYKSLLNTLDDSQAAKARAMQRAWTAYRDTTCQFYDDKIQGTMAITMHAACVTRESARRAMLLGFFSRL
ncbi:MAG: lysozyme inhibitor LprI family protein, partial [Bradyrhizobium sp.]